MYFGEALRFSLQALRANKFRSFLTALGLIIGNASVILVVTISIASRDYILDLIRGVGSNLIYAEYSAGTNSSTKVDADFIKMADVEAVRQQLGSRIVAATGVMSNSGRLLINGKEQDVSVIGADEHYPEVRNMALLSGHFIDVGDVQTRQHVVMLTEKLAVRLYGNVQDAVGQVIKLYDLRFTVVGTFKERTGTFGISEITNETVVMPITVMKLFVPVERIDPMYVQARQASDVRPLTAAIKQVLESRHRAGRALRRGESVRHSGGGAAHRAGDDDCADSGIGHRADYFRHRHYEHHAGDGDGAHARDRSAHGSGRIAARGAGAVPHRIGCHQHGGRDSSAFWSDLHSAERAVFHRCHARVPISFTSDIGVVAFAFRSQWA